MNIYQAKTMDDLKSIADEREILINWDSHTWAIVSTLTKDHECEWVKPGKEAEFLLMACRIAVKNCDPNYKGYTPFGDIL